MYFIGGLARIYVSAMLESEPHDVGICLLPVMANLDSDSSAVYSYVVLVSLNLYFVFFDGYSEVHIQVP